MIFGLGPEEVILGKTVTELNQPHLTQFIIDMKKKGETSKQLQVIPGTFKNFWTYCSVVLNGMGIFAAPIAKYVGDRNGR
jgi:hypothetical protein